MIYAIYNGKTDILESVLEPWQIEEFTLKEALEAFNAKGYKPVAVDMGKDIQDDILYVWTSESVARATYHAVEDDRKEEKKDEDNV